MTQCKTCGRLAPKDALRDGQIVRPDKCERCQEYRAMHGHHEDYTLPLEVVWLCTECHGKRHREINEDHRRSQEMLA